MMKDKVDAVRTGPAARAGTAAAAFAGHAPRHRRRTALRAGPGDWVHVRPSGTEPIVRAHRRSRPATAADRGALRRGRAAARALAARDPAARGRRRDALCAESSATSATRTCLPILIEGLKRLEYRGYDSAGVAVVRRRAAARRQGGGQDRASSRRASTATAGRGTLRHRPHPLGHARRAQRRQRPPAHRLQRAASRSSTTASSRTTPRSRQLLSAEGHVFAARPTPRCWPTSSRSYLTRAHARARPSSQRAAAGRGHLRHRGDLAPTSPARSSARARAARWSSASATASTSSPPTSPPIVEHTRQVVYLDDDEMAVLTPRRLPHLDHRRRARSTSEVERGRAGTSTRSRRAASTHFMLKEIFEQPERARTRCAAA